MCERVKTKFALALLEWNNINVRRDVSTYFVFFCFLFLHFMHATTVIT